ncbi:hypothetical protein D3C87_1924250 [compost metagenome]
MVNLFHNNYPPFLNFKMNSFGELYAFQYLKKRIVSGNTSPIKGIFVDSASIDNFDLVPAGNPF